MNVRLPANMRQGTRVRTSSQLINYSENEAFTVQLGGDKVTAGWKVHQPRGSTPAWQRQTDVGHPATEKRNQTFP